MHFVILHHLLLNCWQGGVFISSHIIMPAFDFFFKCQKNSEFTSEGRSHVIIVCLHFAWIVFHTHFSGNVIMVIIYCIIMQKMRETRLFESSRASSRQLKLNTPVFSSQNPSSGLIKPRISIYVLIQVQQPLRNACLTNVMTQRHGYFPFWRRPAHYLTGGSRAPPVRSDLRV